MTHSTKWPQPLRFFTAWAAPATALFVVITLCIVLISQYNTTQCATHGSLITHRHYLGDNRGLRPDARTVDTAESQSPQARTGVYFSSNDRYLSRTIAFLNSFRHFNPTIPLALIPYDDLNDSAELIGLAQQYDFGIYYNKTLLDKIDELPQQLYPKETNKLFNCMRKLAIWNGPFDEFVYIDVDTVVLGSFDFLYPLLKYADVFAATTTSVLSVWGGSDRLDLVRKFGRLTEEQMSFHANAGFIASSKQFATTEELLGRLEPDIKYFRKTNFFRKAVVDQSVLNYLFVTSGKRYSMLETFAKQNVPGAGKTELWGGGEFAPDKFNVTDDFSNVRNVGNPEEEYLYVHWAGSRKCEAERNFGNCCILWEHWRNRTWHSGGSRDRNF